ncbi:MAG TPA: tetratricopeptide repeat protein [Pyrinomonadaceae bacterium]|nr:tetratricopeptide repeat protein [Pyrinomonadaceae bacterium]
MKTKMQVGLMRIAIGIACTLMFGLGSVSAQMDPGSGAKPARSVENKVPVNQTTGESANEKPSRTPRVEMPAKNASATPTTLQPDVAQPNVDPITALRDQIEAAATVQERVDLQLKLVDQLVLAGKKQDARNQLGQMLAEDRFDPQSFYNIGNAFARLGDADGAVVSYRKAIDQRKGRYSKALNNLAVVLMRRGDWGEANEALIAALKLESFRYAEASYNLGRLYAAQRQMDLAIREWHRALKVDPNHIAAAQAIAQAGSDGQIAVDALQPLADKNEKVKQSAKNEKESGATRNSAASRMLTVDQATFNYLQHAREAHERGKDQEAIENYHRVIFRMGGYFAPANLELSYILIGLKQSDEALVYLKPVTIKDGARYPISYYHIGRIYEVKDELGMAAQAYETAAGLYRGVNPQFLLDISRVREKRGDYKGALAAMEAYLAAVEQQGTKPQWSEERLASLRQKLSESQPKQ